MDRSGVMGLAMFVPMIGLPQGHANRKPIKTIPNVPLNTNNVVSHHNFGEHEVPPCYCSTQDRKWNQTPSSSMKLHGIRKACARGLIIANIIK